MAAAPSRKARMSAPTSTPGSRPTALVMLVRPPTQSNMSKRASQPSRLASWSRRLPSMVTATACSCQLPPRLSSRARTCSMPMRGSGVPPDLLTTTTKVWRRPSPRRSSV